MVRLNTVTNRNKSILYVNGSFAKQSIDMSYFIVYFQDYTLLKESYAFEIFNLVKNYLIHFIFVNIFSTIDLGDVSSISGSSEAPTYESLSISERKDVLKNVSSVYITYYVLVLQRKKKKSCTLSRVNNVNFFVIPSLQTCGVISEHTKKMCTRFVIIFYSVTYHTFCRIDCFIKSLISSFIWSMIFFAVIHAFMNFRGKQLVTKRLNADA